MALCFGQSMVGTSGTNGDAYYISDDSKTFLLADGASGAGKEGKVIMSELCVEIIKEKPFSTYSCTPKEYLEKLIWKINRELTDVSQKYRKNIFGTIVVGVVDGNKGTIACIGDSPDYHIHKGMIRRVAKTQKTYQNLIDLGLYTECELEDAIRKLPYHMWSMFDRFIPMVVPTYSVEEVELEQGDNIIFCCDGVSDYIEPTKLNEMIDADNLPKSISAIIDLARENSIKAHNSMRYDDLTVVVYSHCVMK